jgi:hypothetical protein
MNACGKTVDSNQHPMSVKSKRRENGSRAFLKCPCQSKELPFQKAAPVNHNGDAFGVRGNRSCSTTPFTHSEEFKRTFLL